MLYQGRGEGTLVCAGIPSMFLSQEIVGSILCQFKITRQMLFLAQCRWGFFDLLYFQLFVWLFFFFSLLQTSASVLAEELHKVWASISSGIWEVLLAFSACHLPSTHVQSVWEGLVKEMLLSVLLTSHEINWGAGQRLPTDFPSVSGLRFGFCCSSELQRKQHPLCCLSLPVCRVSAACRNVRDRENCYYLGCGAVPGGFSLWEMGW